jgi:hypothetical protein
MVSSTVSFTRQLVIFLDCLQRYPTARVRLGISKTNNYTASGISFVNVLFDTYQVRPTILGRYDDTI